MGCATTGTLQNGVYRGEQTSYQIGPVGSDWTPVTVGHQNDLAWHNEAKGAVMHADSDCDPGLDIPVVPMDGREALRTHFTAKLDGVPRDILLQILKKDDCVYDFGLITPPGPSFDEALADFDAMLAGFTTITGQP
jgi:hypothetical protein